jgi:hypothetical protein
MPGHAAARFIELNRNYDVDARAKVGHHASRGFLASQTSSRGRDPASAAKSGMGYAVGDRLVAGFIAGVVGMALASS